MFETPFTAIISGATQTGKSKWLLRLIKNLKEMTNEPPEHILYCYSEINPDTISLKKDGFEIYNGIPTKEEILERPKNTLLILDDLINEIDPKYLETLYIKGSHHWNVSIILVTQNLFDKNIKVARINSHYIILMKNPQGLLQIRTLGSHLFPGKLNYFLEAYNDAIEQNPYGYLVINLKPTIPDDLRLSTNLFPNETATIYLPV
jgi:hypothetical protein